MKRLKLDRKHNDKDDMKLRVDVAFAQGLSQGLRDGRAEAEKQYAAEVRDLNLRLLNAKSNEDFMKRERNQHRQNLMDLQRELGTTNARLDAAVALLKRAQLASTNPEATLTEGGYTFQNGVLIHESTAREAENERTLEDDLNGGLADEAARQLDQTLVGAPSIALNTNIDPHVHRNNTPVRLSHADAATGPDQTAIAIRGADGQFSHYEYPDEDEALGRDREQWGPPGQEEDPEEGAVRAVRFGTTLGGRFHPSGAPITLTGREYTSDVRLPFAVLEDEEADPEEVDPGYDEPLQDDW